MRLGVGLPVGVCVRLTLTDWEFDCVIVLVPVAVDDCVVLEVIDCVSDCVALGVNTWLVVCDAPGVIIWLLVTLCEPETA